MAIVNRDLDSSEQNYVENVNLAAVATGVTVAAVLVKAPGQLIATRITGTGLSGTPVYNVLISRWTSAGVTTINPGSALTLASAFGVSGGAIGASYAINSSLAAVQAGDLLSLVSSGANTAAAQLIGSFVIKATQDIKSSFGLS